MGRWPIDDRLALLIGRVILAFGNLDQQIYHSIQMLCASAGTTPTADNRFAHRLKELRSLVRLLADNDRAFMSEFDTFQGELKDVEQKRADLAHGIPFPKVGSVEFYTNRNPQKWRPLSMDELEEMPDAIFDLRQRLFGLQRKAQKLNASRSA